MRVAFVTVGCKVNQAESEAMAELLREGGWEIVPYGEGSDLVVLNTCVVTAKAEADSRKWLRRIRREIPGARVIVTGCWPQLDPEAPIAIGADAVLGNQEKASIGEAAQAVMEGVSFQAVGEIRRTRKIFSLPIRRPRFHTRAFLKVQDGCNARCRYCVVPLVRGRERSLPPEEVLKALKGLEEEGVREVVLVGIHLGVYGRDLSPPMSLRELLLLLEEASTPPRIRLSSIEPDEVDEGLLQVIASSKKICPHLHLPLQSGDERVLREMGRKYSPGYFRDLISSIRSRMPDAAIGVDVLVGFPGEDEGAFQRTYRLIEELDVTYLHVFPFSPRPGTPASSLPHQVSDGVKKGRVMELRRLGQKKRLDFYSRYVGRRLQVLIEGRRREGIRGLSRNYLFCLLEDGSLPLGEEIEGVALSLKEGRLIVRPTPQAATRSPMPSRSGVSRV